MPLLEQILTWTQLAVLTSLALLGLHRGWMALLSVLVGGHRTGTRSEPGPAEPQAQAPSTLPRVTVQLPIYNEPRVAGRLLDAVFALDYPRQCLQIQILDDSDDATSSVIADRVRRAPAGLDVEHLRRTERTHFKAGALAAGLRSSSSELVAMFDADFTPEPGFLRRIVAHFDAADVGMVQARWEHLNPDYSLLTQMQALLLDGHFAVEHIARARAGCFFNFNGTAGVFRRACIEQAGGWQGDTLTEDMDLSYRAQLAGWRFVYRPELACPAELPIEVNAFLHQQHRWAKGSIQTARKLLPRILRTVRRPLVLLEAVFHLLGNAAFPLLLLLILIALPLQWLRVVTEALPPAWLIAVESIPMLLSTACVLAYYGLAQRRLRRGLGGLMRAPLILAVGAGLCVNNTAAVLGGMRRRTGSFERTPKHDLRGAQAPPPPAEARPRGLLPWLEIGLGLWALTTSALSIHLAMPATAGFHALFAFGLLWIGGASLTSQLAGRAPAAISPRPATGPRHYSAGSAAGRPRASSSDTAW